ncbi:tetraspanin-10 [Gastrophryne carolinensis]
MNQPVYLTQLFLMELLKSAIQGLNLTSAPKITPRTSKTLTLNESQDPEASPEEDGRFQYYVQEDGAGQPQSRPPKEWLLLSRYRPDPLVPFVKYFMFGVNSIFFTLGAAVLCTGFWGLSLKQSLIGDNISGLGSDPMLVFVLVGLVVCVFSLSGCIGFIRENICLLRFFLVGITVLMVVQCSVAIVVLCFQEQIQDSVKSTMMVAMSRYQDDADLRFLLDEMQLGMECCGVESYQDWAVNLYFNCSSPSVLACGVPYSCCIDPLQNGTVPNSQCGFGALEMGEALASGLVYLGGCVPQMLLWLRSKMWDIAAVFVLAAGVQLLAMVCAQRVMRHIEVIRSLH